jgi:hypothetical protein
MPKTLKVIQDPAPGKASFATSRRRDYRDFKIPHFLGAVDRFQAGRQTQEDFDFFQYLKTPVGQKHYKVIEKEYDDDSIDPMEYFYHDYSTIAGPFRQ